MCLRTNRNIQVRRPDPAGAGRQVNKSNVRSLTLQGLTITGGNTSGPGGGIFNLEGALTLNHSRVTGNASAGGMMSADGGIASGTLGNGPSGTAVLNLSQVNGNTTSGSADGISGATAHAPTRTPPAGASTIWHSTAADHRPLLAATSSFSPTMPGSADAAAGLKNTALADNPNASGYTAATW